MGGIFAGRLFSKNRHRVFFLGTPLRSINGLVISKVPGCHGVIDRASSVRHVSTHALVHN